jgi:predicted component of type VI protein secretion system
MPARLVPLDGSPPIELVKDLTLIGRTEDCDLRIDHKSISKIHCVLAVTDGLVLVRDLGSTNGTRVNGQRIRRGILLPNDHFAVANFRYRLKIGPEPEGHTEPVVVAPHPVDAPDEVNDTPPPSPNLSKNDPGPAIRRNTLPDVYPDAPKKPNEPGR